MGRTWSRESTITPYVAKTDADEAYKLNHAPKFKNAEQYIQAKLKMLVNDFCIYPTETEIKHLYELETESKINLAVRQIINDHWK